MIYLNNAATSHPKPEVVEKAILQALKQGFGSSGRSASFDADRLLFKLRRNIGSLLDFHYEDQIIITKNATEALNIAIMGLVKEKMKVVYEVSAHNAVLRPLYHLEKTKNVELYAIEPLSRDKSIEKLSKLIDQEAPDYLVLTHASNVTGEVCDLQVISDLCKEGQVKLIIDASQTVGHCKLSLENIAFEALAAPGHKGLMGPQGVGFLLLDNEDNISPVLFGGTGTSSSSKEMPSKSPERFEAGTGNILGIAGLNAAIEYLRELDLRKVEEKVHQLTTYLHDQVSSINGLHLISSRDNNIGIASFYLEGKDASEVSRLLDSEYDIITRSGLHCAPLIHEYLETKDKGGLVRVSPGYFTRIEEIDLLVEALGKIGEY